MAELLGVVASGAGLASLAIQLTDGIVKLRSLYKASKNAPQSVSEMIFELEAVSLLVRGLEQRQYHDEGDSEILVRCIVACCSKIDRLCELLGRMERQMPKFHGYGKMYSAFKEPEAKKLLDELDRARGLLSLAYMDHCEAHSRRENAINAASTLAREVYLHQQLADLQRTVQSGNTMLIQQMSILTQPGSAVQTGMRTQTNVLVRQRPRVEPQPNASAQRWKNRTRRKHQWQARVWFPSWLTTRAWDIFAAYETNGSLGFQIQPVNIRPDDTTAFYYARTGDTKSVRALLESGQLSLWDCDPSGQSLLSMAAFSGSLELCKMLLDDAPHLRVDHTLLDALMECTAYPLGLASQESITRLLVEDYKTDVDVAGDTPMADLLSREWIPATCQMMLMSHQTIPLKDQPFQARFDVLMNIRMYPPEAFLRDLAHDVCPEQLVSARDQEGRTALHWATETWSLWLCTNESVRKARQYPQADFYTLVRTLLQMGADPLARDFSGRSPLCCLLKIGYGWDDLESLKMTVELWGEAIQDAGTCLTDYVNVENASHYPMMIKVHHLESSGNEHDLLGVDGICVVPTSPPRLTVKSRAARVVRIWMLAAVPGSYEREGYVPRQICWNPRVTEAGEVFRRTHREVIIYPSTTPCENTEKVRREWENLAHIVYEAQFSTAQDDHGRVALMAQTTCHRARSVLNTRPSRPRSSSVPIGFTVSRSVLVDKPDWKPALHKCSGHMSWQPAHVNAGHIDEQTRVCARSPPDAWADLQRMWRWQIWSWEGELVHDRARREVAGKFVDRFWPDPRSYLRQDWEGQLRVDEMDRVIEEHIRGEGLIDSQDDTM